MVGVAPIGRLAVIAWLVLLGLAATIVGGHDAVAATEVNARLFGTFVLGAGLVMLAGAVGLRGDRPHGRALAALAALLGIALGGLIFVAQVVNDEPDIRLIAWGAIIVVSVAAFRAIRQATPDDERAEAIWSRLPILKSAISLGVLVSAAQFWYTSIYVPTTAPANLSLEPKLDVSQARQQQLMVKGSVTIRNTSGTRVNVLAASLDIAGKRVDAGTTNQEGLREAIQQVDLGQLESANRYTPGGDSSSVAHGPLVEQGTYFEPGEVVSVPILTLIPEGEFDSLHLYAWLAIARGKVLGDTPDSRPRATRDSVIILTDIPEAGWLRRLTRGDRYVRAEYPSDPAGNLPQVFFAPDRKPDPPDDFDERLKRFYGAIEISAEEAFPLPPS